MALSVLFLLASIFFGFLPHKGNTLTDQGKIWQGGHSMPNFVRAIYHLDRFMDVALRPQNLKNCEFYQYNSHKGQVPCAILTKIYSIYASLQAI